MKAYEVIEKCDIKDIAEYLIKEHSHYYKDVNETMAKVKLFLDDFHSRPLEELTQEEKDNGFVLVVRKTACDDDLEPLHVGYRKFVTPKLSQDKLSYWMITDAIYLKELVEKRDLLNYSYKEIREKDLMPFVMYGVDCVSRNHVMNYEVIPTSIEKYGMVTVAAELFWEFTFYGLLGEDVQKESDRLSSSLDEIKKIEDYAKEHNISVMEAGQILGYPTSTMAFDDCYDEEDDEELEETEEDIEFRKYIEESKDNPSYMKALNEISYFVGDVITNDDNEFFKDFLNKHSNDDMVKRFF